MNPFVVLGILGAVGLLLFLLIQFLLDYRADVKRGRQYRMTGQVKENVRR